MVHIFIQDAQDVKAVKVLEKMVGFKQGKGGMWKSCITVHKDIQIENAEKYLKTSKEEQPKIVIFQ